MPCVIVETPTQYFQAQSSGAASIQCSRNQISLKRLLPISDKAQTFDTGSCAPSTLSKAYDGWALESNKNMTGEVGNQ